MEMIQKLRGAVERNCISSGGSPTTLKYWSEVLFAKSVFALAPLSLLAIIPAVIICLKSESYLILGFDIFCLSMLVLVGYAPGISVNFRKVILTLLVFMASFILLMELGSFGPGLVYLFAATVFMLVFFPNQNKFLPLLLTLAFCIVYGLLIHFKAFRIYPEGDGTLLAWVAISSNVLFLSAFLTLMIPFFFSKLESTIAEKLQLLDSVRMANLDLEKSVAEVKKKNAQLEEYAFVASHDLQEQLRMISSFQTKLVKNYKDQLDQKAQQYIFFATEGAYRMKQIIQELLDHSSVGSTIYHPEEVNLKKLLGDYIKTRTMLIAEKSAQFEFSEVPPIIVGNRAPLTQTLHCLLDNAITYSRQGIAPKIKLTVVDHVEEWLFSIQDNGIGIDNQFFDKIFVIFQRLHNRDQYSGTGIGLSIAKKNVESWDGKIWLESTPGLGSTFFFTLPKSHPTNVS